MLKYTKATDPDLYEIVMEELDRQIHNIELIASESIVPPAVLELNGSVFTNKSLEGLPGKRFHAGGQIVDKMEILLNQRTCELFGADHANHQVYSGSTANYGVYSAVLEPGDKVLSMSLDQGGHLTHGSPANFLTKVYHFEHYGINPTTEVLDYDALADQAKEFRPKLIIAGASSYPRLIDYKTISEIAKSVGAYFMVDMAHVTGLVAAKLIPSPVPYADFVTSSTTKTTLGPRSGFIMCKEEYAKKLDRGVFPGCIGGIHPNTMASKCWCMKYMATEEFRGIMKQVMINTSKLADELAKRNFRIVSGGTDNHLMVVDLRNKNITGRDFQDALNNVGITVNKNAIPFDPQSPLVTSGARIGSTSATQRGFKEYEMEIVADIIDRVTNAPQDEANLAECRQDCRDLIAKFPLYPDDVLADQQ